MVSDVPTSKLVAVVLPLLATQLVLLAQPSPAPKKIGYIEFFGYKGLDLPAIRKALPFREGDTARPTLKDEAESAVEHVIGRKATDIFIACCTGRGEQTVFIGLPGASSRPLAFEPAPQGAVSFPGELASLYRKMSQAEKDATFRSLAEEDNPGGYRLLKEPVAHAAELSFRAYALGHEEESIQVLTSSADADQRAMAAEALGFSARTSQQMAALVSAARDPDEAVRNNVTRALFEILRGDPSAASQIPPDNFIDMLRSGTWTDRNKGSMLLMFVTQSRDPILLRRIQSEAGDALLEMSRWREAGRAMPACMILARIQGKSDFRAYLDMVPGSAWGSAALAIFVSGLLAFAFAGFPSKLVKGAIALLAPALVSPVLYWVLVRVARSVDVSDDTARVFLLPWYLAAAAASAIVIFTLTRRARA
jgi:HEAT repeats